MATSLHSQGRRIKAAAELGGFSSLEALAREVNLPNLSAKSLSRSANDNRTAGEHELRAIAKACDLPYEFFTIDLVHLAEAPALGHQAASGLPANVTAAGERTAAADLAHRLQALEGIIGRMDAERQEVLERYAAISEQMVTVLKHAGGDPEAVVSAEDAAAAAEEAAAAARRRRERERLAAKPGITARRRPA